MNTTTNPRAMQHRILTLLEDFSTERLVFIEQWLRLMREESFTTPQPSPAITSGYRYPTVATAALSLRQWINLVSAGYVGDALADTEQLDIEV